MSRGTGTWLAICLITFLSALLSGVIFGWSLRAGTADHRYIIALAQRHESEASYYISKLDQEIQKSKGEIARERKPQK